MRIHSVQYRNKKLEIKRYLLRLAFINRALLDKTYRSNPLGKNI